MPEYRVRSYERLTRELDIPVLSPEIAAGSLYTRADWILREASDMTRIDVLRGGITGVKKMVSIAEAYGVRCEIHMSGFGNLQILGATSEDTCEYYERGLLAPGVTYDAPPPYLNGAPGSGDGIRYQLGLYRSPSRADRRLALSPLVLLGPLDLDAKLPRGVQGPVGVP